MDSKNMSPSCIFQTLKNLIFIYQRNLALDDFDETIFLEEKNISQTPFTPFSKQGIKNQIRNHLDGAYNHKKEKNLQTNINIQNFNCQRILNYEIKKEDEKPNNQTQTTNKTLPQLV